MNDVSDEELISSWLKARNELAARGLFDRWLPRVQRFCLAWCGGSIEDAEDLSQEVLSIAFGGLEGFRQRSGFGTWLFAIAKRKAMDLTRKRVRENKRLEQAARRSQADYELRLYAGDPAMTVESLSDSEGLWQKLMTLSPEDRSMIVLFEVDGLSLKELSRLFGLKAGTVKSRLSRSRSKLAQQTDLEKRGQSL